MCVVLTQAAELAYDVGQGDVSHTLQLILDIPWQHRVAQVPGLDGALHQWHPSAAMPLPKITNDKNNNIIINHNKINGSIREKVRLHMPVGQRACGEELTQRETEADRIQEKYKMQQNSREVIF